MKAPFSTRIPQLGSTPAPGVAGRALASSRSGARIPAQVTNYSVRPRFSAGARKTAPGAGALPLLFRNWGLTILLLGRLASAQVAPVSPAGHLELFNGRDFTGWTFCMKNNADPMATWSVTNGVIHCTGRPIGYLRTEQAYANYILTVEWRFLRVTPKFDNTGVLVNMQLPDKVWPPCVQVQGRHAHQGDLFLMAGAESKEHQGLNANTPLPLRGGPNEHPVGEWDTVKTVVVTTNGPAGPSGTITAYVNGRLMNETTECTLTNGFIGIQSEGGEIEIRKLSLDPVR